MRIAVAFFIAGFLPNRDDGRTHGMRWLALNAWVLGFLAHPRRTSTPEPAPSVRPKHKKAKT